MGINGAGHQRPARVDIGATLGDDRLFGQELPIEHRAVPGRRAEDAALARPGGPRPVVVRSAPRRRFRDLVELAESVLWEADPQTLDLAFITGHAERLFGYPVERWLGPTDLLQTIVIEEDREVLRQRAAVMRGNGGTVEYRVRTADDRLIWIREAIRVANDDRGERTAVHGAMLDISELREAEHATLRLKTMLEANARASAASGEAGAPTADEAVRGRFQQALAVGLDELLDPRATARRVARVLGTTLHLGFVALYDAQTSAMLAWWPSDVARQEHAGACEIAARLDELDASVPFLPLRERCAHVPDEVGALAALPLVDGKGEVIGALAIGAEDRAWFADAFRIELRWYALQIGKALSVALTCERLEAGAARDPLTRLLRRDDFYLRFAQERERATRTGATLALLRWDFVRFAEFNARHGRRMGDRALRAFADVVRAELRSYDVAGRIDGDAMAALLFVTKHQEAHIAAARIQKRAALTRVGDVFIPFPARGFALFPDDGQDVPSLDRVSLARLANHRETRLAFVRTDESARPVLRSELAAAAD